MRVVGFAFAVVVVIIGACAGQPNGPAAPSDASDRLTVVTSTTVIADFVANVGGARVDVHPLVPKGGEAHTFDPAPSDAARISDAQLLVLNGLGLDDWLLGLARDSGHANLPAIALAEGLEEVEYLEGDGGLGEAANPHLWMNVGYARLYVDRIRLKLTELDPAGQAIYDANADAYDDQLADLDGYIHDELASIPEDDRRVVTFHDAFPYFAAAYGLEIAGVVVDAPGQDPSAGEVARLVTAIKQTGVKAILAEAQFSDRPADAIADETNATVVSGLYTDSLGDAPQDTFDGAMRWNVDEITAALR